MNIDKKIKTILERFERPYLNITLIPNSTAYCLSIGECGSKKFVYSGASLSKLVEEALIGASPELKKPNLWVRPIDWKSIGEKPQKVY